MAQGAADAANPAYMSCPTSATTASCVQASHKTDTLCKAESTTNLERPTNNQEPLTPQQPSESQFNVRRNATAVCKSNTCYAPYCQGQCQALQALCPEGLQRVQGRTTYEQLLILAKHQIQLADCQEHPMQPQSAWVYCPTHLLKCLPPLESRLIPLLVNDLLNLLQDNVHQHLYMALPAKDPPELHKGLRGWAWLPADHFLSCFQLASSSKTHHEHKLYCRRLPRSARQWLRTSIDTSANAADAETSTHMGPTRLPHKLYTNSTLCRYAVNRAYIPEIPGFHFEQAQQKEAPSNDLPHTPRVCVSLRGQIRRGGATGELIELRQSVSGIHA
jgi:hypothetical protein